MEQDALSIFIAKQYVSKGESLHFHRNLEIYGVVKGNVVVNIMGQRMKLTNGQIAIIDGLENHSYEVDGEAEVFSIHLGIPYLRTFFSLYPGKRLPLWLMDVEYNKVLNNHIQKLLNAPQQNASELERIGNIYQLLSNIVEHYGINEKFVSADKDNDLITNVVQYIYEHYNENITLETLSKIFYVSPKALGMKIGKRLNVDLRVFVNDIRVQKAIQMKDDLANKDKSLNEIASICGFNNMKTFYRCYERNFTFRNADKEEKQ